ncbi:hypothetical protein CYLTODRAFT_388737, partial [Cylindrobasidium torrendii FP15055 ss-10]
MFVLCLGLSDRRALAGLFHRLLTICIVAVATPSFFAMTATRRARQSASTSASASVPYPSSSLRASARTTKKASAASKPFRPALGDSAARINDAPKWSLTMEEAENAPAAEPFFIRDQKLVPTKAWNVFFWWCSERHQVELKKRAGMPAPWTDDQNLQGTFACNTFRVLDKQCQYIITNVIEKGSQEPREVLFRILLYNSFTNIETWEAFEKAFGTPTWAAYDRGAYEAVLQARDREGHAVFTGAFQKQNGGMTPAWLHHFNVLENMMASDTLLRRLRPGPDSPPPTMKHIYEWLLTYSGFGPFGSYQLCLNLSYSELLRYSPLGFVVPGPGAQSGLHKLFGPDKYKAVKKALGYAKQSADDLGFDTEVLRYIADIQESEFARIGLAPPVLSSQHRLMGLADIEHAVCEVDKHLRRSHPEIRHGKANVKDRHFRTGTLEENPFVLPKVWNRKEWQWDGRVVTEAPDDDTGDEPKWKIEAI